MLDDKKIEEILEHGNTAEVKKTKRGVIILEVSRKIRYEDYEEDEETETSTDKTDKTDKADKTDKTDK
jgi:hypothetical protein